MSVRRESEPDASRSLSDIVDRLCASDDHLARTRPANGDDHLLPSRAALTEIVEALRAALFPGYVGVSELTQESLRYHVGVTLDRAQRILRDQIERGFWFNGSYEREQHAALVARAAQVTSAFLAQLPDVRHLLSTDVDAAYEGDPAAMSRDETIFCYPGVLAITNHRLAHELYCLDVPLLPRMIAEQAHSLTGIDIHPGAMIGERFFIDHGTGVVIGETCEIGKNVRIYQGVTLGAKSFPLDADGKPIKGIPRHPIVEDDVIVYGGATILGRITIGRGAVIGGNVWLTQDVPPGGRLRQAQPQQARFAEGAGI